MLFYVIIIVYLNLKIYIKLIFEIGKLEFCIELMLKLLFVSNYNYYEDFFIVIYCMWFIFI